MVELFVEFIMFRLSLFGGFLLEDRKGNALKITTRKAQHLLAYLLLHQDQAHARERLVGLFWPDISENRAKQNLRQALYSLRKVLEPKDSSNQFIVANQQTIQIQPANFICVDAVEFEESVKKSQALTDRKKIDSLSKAIECYQGNLLEGCYDDWCLEERDYFRNLYLSALENLISYLSHQQKHKQAITYARQSLSQDPFQERIHYQLMQLYLTIGDRVAAIQQFHECETVLRDELGVEPLPETRVLFEQINNRSATQTIKELIAKPIDAFRQHLELGTPFVGRLNALQMFTQIWECVLNGEGTSWFIGGEAGVGKSRLAQECMHFAVDQNAYVFYGRCFEFEGKLPFQALLEALRYGLAQIPKSKWKGISAQMIGELVNLAPDLRQYFPKVQTVTALNSPEQERSRQLEALKQFFNVLSEKSHVLLVLDDIQWADETTLQFVHFFARQVAQSRIVFLCLYRDNEVLSEHPLWPIIQDLTRNQMSQFLSLNPLSELSTQQLVNGMLQTDAFKEFGDHIYQESKGIPFFIEELIKSSLESGILLLDEDGKWQIQSEDFSFNHLPTSIHALIDTRLRRLSKVSRTVLEFASVVGRAFTYEEISNTLRKESALLQSLEELLAVKLLTEKSKRYAFHHDLFRQKIYTGLSSERRRRFHLNFGEALESIYDSYDSENILGDLALHFYEAQQWKKALSYSLSAGQQTWSKTYAKDSASLFFERALEIAGRLEDKDSLMKAYKGLGEVCAATDDQDRGYEFCQKALELCQNREQKAEIYLSLATIYHHKREMEAGLAQCEKAIEVIGQDAKNLVAVQAYFKASTFLNWLSDFDKAILYCNLAMKILKINPDEYYLSLVLTELGIAHCKKGDYEESKQHLSEATRLAQETGDPLAIAIANFKLGSEFYESGKLELSIENCKESLKIFEFLGNQHSNLGGICNYLAFSFVRLGNINKAIEYGHLQHEAYKNSGNEKEIGASLGILGCLYDSLGSLELSTEYFKRAIHLNPRNGLLFHYIIYTFLLLQKIDKAIDWLEKGAKYLKGRHIKYFKTCQNYTNAFIAFREHPLFKSIASKIKE